MMWLQSQRTTAVDKLMGAVDKMKGAVDRMRET
jgi:hypothetical protein